MDTTSHTAPDGAPGTPPPSTRPPLRRCRDDRLLGGVAAGLARSLGADVGAVRVVVAVACLLAGAGVPLYLAAWLLLPEEDTDRSILDDVLGRPR